MLLKHLAAQEAKTSEAKEFLNALSWFSKSKTPCALFAKGQMDDVLRLNRISFSASAMK